MHRKCKVLNYIYDLPTENIVALLAWSASHRSVFSHNKNPTRQRIRNADGCPGTLLYNNNQLRFICHRQRSFCRSKNDLSSAGQKFLACARSYFLLLFLSNFPQIKLLFLLNFFNFFLLFFCYLSLKNKSIFLLFLL